VNPEDEPRRNETLELAEASTLGAIMQDREHAASVFIALRIEDFTGKYRLIAEAMHGLRLARKPLDAVAVADEMTRRGTLGRIGGLAELTRVAGFGLGDPAYHVDIIARVARLRRAEQIGVRQAALSRIPDADPFVIAKAAIEANQAIIDGIEAEGDITTPSLAEFLSGDDPPHDWVIPGLLERGDRLILTGSEGLGKSVLFRQLAVSTAAGVHPFNHGPIPPKTVLYVDVENGYTKMRRALRDLAGLAKRHNVDGADQRLWIECRPEGLDLTKPEDEQWLIRRVAALQPALLVIGPLYRLHNDDPNKEEPARKVTQVLDRCRAAANCALITEAHAGHGSGSDGVRAVRPTGTSLWLRWPEFGYGLRMAENFNPQDRRVDFVPWRGDRDAREWPKRLQQGTRWPWERGAEDQYL
jgi:replicative DNA helicase